MGYRYSIEGQEYNRMVGGFTEKFDSKMLGGNGDLIVIPPIGIPYEDLKSITLIANDRGKGATLRMPNWDNQRISSRDIIKLHTQDGKELIIFGN